MTHLDTNSNLVTDIVDIMYRALISENNPNPLDGEQTRVVIEHPDGSYEPVTFAWYDMENNIIRLNYEG